MRLIKVVTVFMALLIALLYAASGLAVFNNMIYDTLYEEAGDISSDIVIVGIDDSSYEKIGRWPYSRSLQSKIFANILAGQPAVLGIDIVYNAETDSEEDSALVSVLKGEPVVLAEYIGSNYADAGKYGEARVVQPFDALKDEVATGYINTMPDSSDGNIRKTDFVKVLDGEIYKSFPYEIYSLYLEANNIKSRFSDVPSGHMYIDYKGPPESYRVISAYKVLNGSVPTSFFEGKIVLFGPYAEGMQDNFPTPLNKREEMYGVEIHANILQNFMEDSFRHQSDFLVEFLMIALVALVCYFMGRVDRIWLVELGFTGIILVLFAVGKAVYEMGYVLEIVYPIALALVMNLWIIGYQYFQQRKDKLRMKRMFGRYVARQVVDELLEEGEENLKLGGSRKLVTLLFVDIRGFTPLSELAEPEEVVEILNQYLDLCTKAIFHFDGTLDKFIGDAAMAIYNAPLPLQDHAFCAVQTAWEMKMEGEMLSQRIQETFGRRVRFGIGINTGEAIIGNIGAESRMDYTAIGDTVNTAARFESQAKAGQILIGERTYEMVKDRVEVTCLEPIKLKGKSKPVRVYEVIGIKQR